MGCVALTVAIRGITVHAGSVMPRTFAALLHPPHRVTDGVRCQRGADCPEVPRPRKMKTYRDEIRRLDSLATPAPWVTDGELYGGRENGSSMPLGFAPHRPLDGRLIAVYRSAVVQLIEAVDAVERLARRAGANASVPAAIGIRQILTLLDSWEGETTSYRSSGQPRQVRQR